MLEIILLISFGRKLAELAREKGRSAGWAALGVMFWLGGEFIGFIIGALLGLEGLAVYPIALLVGATGAFVAWMVVKNLPAVSSPSL
jgi:hypothetical protein